MLRPNDRLACLAEVHLEVQVHLSELLLVYVHMTEFHIGCRVLELGDAIDLESKEKDLVCSAFRVHWGR